MRSILRIFTDCKISGLVSIGESDSLRGRLPNSSVLIFILAVKLLLFILSAFYSWEWLSREVSPAAAVRWRVWEIWVDMVLITSDKRCFLPANSS